MSGKVERLWLKRAHGGVMDPVEEIELVAGEGIVGSANQGAPRHVTLIDRARWNRAAEELATPDLDPSFRRADVLLTGLPLAETRGRRLRLGSALLEIRGETRPCGLMDEQHEGLRAALDADWGGGAHGIVLEGGTARVGDNATWEEARAGI
jgi:MOSC domain-containing protein YiiM